MKKILHICSYIAICLAVVGIALCVIGALAFCQASGVGANMLWSSNGIVITGIVLAVAAVVAAIVLKVIRWAKKEDNTLAWITVEAALTALLVIVVFLVLFTVMPVLMPANG